MQPLGSEIISMYSPWIGCASRLPPSLAQSLRPSVGADGNVDLQEEPLATRKEVVGHAQNVVPNGFRMVFDTEKFEEANSTENCGLGVNTRDGDSQHFGAPLFQACQEAT